MNAIIAAQLRSYTREFGDAVAELGRELRTQKKGSSSGSGQHTVSDDELQKFLDQPIQDFWEDVMAQYMMQCCSDDAMMHMCSCSFVIPSFVSFLQSSAPRQTWSKC